MGSPEFESCMDALDVLREQLEQHRERFEARKVKIDAIIGEKREGIEEKRRTGECGRAWQILQQRIDLGQTCERDILMGIDKSPEAREVRHTIQSNVVSLYVVLHDAKDETNEAAQLHEQLEEKMQRLHELERKIQP